MAPEMSTVSESVKTAATASPTESEIATVAYRLWLERGGPTASDQQDWLRAEAMLKNALVVKCEDLFRRASMQCSDTRTESEMPADFRWEGHWEVWEREWGGARWVWDVRGSGVGVSNRARAAGQAAWMGRRPCSGPVSADCTGRWTSRKWLAEDMLFPGWSTSPEKACQNGRATSELQ